MMNWTFTKDNLENLQSRYKDAFLLGRILGNAAEGFHDNAMATDVKKFFEEHPVPSAKRVISQSIEKIRCQHTWLHAEKQGLDAYFC